MTSRRAGEGEPTGGGKGGSPPLTPPVEDFVARLTGRDPRFVSEISAGDEMYHYSLQSLRGSRDAASILYFEKGGQIADAFLSAFRWRFSGRAPASVLDFASGFGRATRFLARALPAGALAVSEIDPEAVAFQKRVFGVRGFLSSAGAADFRPGRRFDAITAASFFSHLPARAFEEWLAALWDLLEPGGLLVFSVHGPALLPGPADWSDGFVFRAVSETRRLDADAYGTSWVSPAFVEAAAARVAGEGALHGVPFGLCGHQDLYLLERPPLAATPFHRRVIPVVPRGELDRLDIRPGEALAAAGWAEAEEAPDVAFWVGASRRDLSKGEPGAARRRWSFEIPLEGVGPDDVLRVEATSSGRSNILAMGTLRTVGGS